MRVPCVKTGLFDKWESGKKNKIKSSANSPELSDQWGFKLAVTSAALMPRDADPLPQVAMLAM